MGIQCIIFNSEDKGYFMVSEEGNVDRAEYMKHSFLVGGEELTNDDQFDLELFGMLLKKIRKDQGFKKAEDFCEAVLELTGYKISYQVLYRIENGTRAITLPEFLAISIYLSKSLDADELQRAVELSLGKHWETLIKLYANSTDKLGSEAWFNYLESAGTVPF